MKFTSYDLNDFGIVDKVIKEPLGGAHFNKEQTFKNAKAALLTELYALKRFNGLKLRDMRNEKYRNFGFFQRFNYDNLGGVKR